jgi:hypothetical protein
MLTNLLQDEIERAGAGRAALCRFRRSFDTVAVGPRLLGPVRPGDPKPPAGQRLARSVITRRTASLSLLRCRKAR